MSSIKNRKDHEIITSSEFDEDDDEDLLVNKSSMTLTFGNDLPEIQSLEFSSEN
jgi:hypothetical protein